MRPGVLGRAVDLQHPGHEVHPALGVLRGHRGLGLGLAPDVAAMRKVRDRLRPASTMFAVATDLYYRSGPAAAEVLRRSDTARALVRRLLGPVGAASQAAVGAAARHPDARALTRIGSEARRSLGGSLRSRSKWRFIAVSSSRLDWIPAVASALVAVGPTARAQSCVTLQYAFQPDCYRPDESSACVQSVTHMDFGPQIAVWLQDGSGKFVDTLFVTNATARRGIANRPGRWDFLSGPLFPYGKRVMSLPISAHARGKTYATVMMQEAICEVGGPTFQGESCLGYHESYSSEELYFCRPLQQGEAQSAIGATVDAITCPSVFHSEKGKLDPATLSYYPPRSDLTSFGVHDSENPPTYAAINDLDAVAAATPGYGATYNGIWSIP